MSVQEALQSYLSDYLNLTDEDIEKVKIHIELRKQLEQKLKFKNNNEAYSFLTGSYVRGTAIRPPKRYRFLHSA